MRNRCLFAVAVCAAGLALGAPLPVPVVTIGQTSVPPLIDGQLGDACWGQPLGAFVALDMSELAWPQTAVFMTYDDASLYVAIRCNEPAMKSLRADVTERDGALWRDDCVELFLDSNCDRKTYYHLIANAKGALYDSVTPGDANWNGDITVAAAVAEDSWSVEFAIPFVELGGSPGPGALWGVNIGRERYAGGKGQLSAWSATYGKFHEPARFGQVRFAETAAVLHVGVPENVAFGPNTISVTGTPGGAVPTVELLREWPDDIERTWKISDPVVQQGTTGWQAQFRIVDGSEVGLLVSRGQGSDIVFRQALPLVIQPKPQVSVLARQLLAIEARLGKKKSAFGTDVRAVLAEGRSTLEEFLEANVRREKPLAASEWSKLAGQQARIVTRIAGLSYALWTKSCLDDVGRHEMPRGLEAIGQISLLACGNEIESGTVVVTNLSDRTLEGRLKVADLSLANAADLGFAEKPNLLENGELSADRNGDGVPDGWRRNACRDVAFSIDALPDGETAFSLRGGTSGRATANFRQTCQLTAGTTYTLQADLSSDKLLPETGFVHLINKGWTWSKALKPRGRTTGSMRYALSFRAPKSDFFQVVLRLHNPRGGVIRYHSIRLVEGGIETPTFSADAITLHDVVFQNLRTGKEVADALPRMNGAHTLTVPAGETRQVWVSVDTSALPPGEYSSSLSLTPFDRLLPPKSVSLRLRVLPVRLPDRMPIAVFNWDYARNEHYVRDLVDHGTNTFLMNTHCLMEFNPDGSMRTAADWRKYDKMLHVKVRYARKQGGIVLFSYGIIRDFHKRMTTLHGWEFMSEPWKRAFKAWVLEFERHMRDDIGLNYEEYAVQLWDEATNKNAKLTVQGGLFIREIAPKVRTCMDGAQSVAEVKAMDPVIDLWIPHQTTLYRSKERKELRALYRELMAKGEPVWTYTCSTNMKAMHPLDYYRLKEWRVWELGLQGSCYWAYNSWRGDPWNDFDGKIADCGSVYDGPSGPITTRRWEATRDGREDYKCLHMLRNANGSSGRDASVDEIVKEALASPLDAAAFAAQREVLLTRLSEAVGRESAGLAAGVRFAKEDGKLRARWELTRPAAGFLFYRVPGEAEWKMVETAEGAKHVATLVGVEARRSVEWYLLWRTGAGCMGCCLSGLQPDGWARPGE